MDLSAFFGGQITGIMMLDFLARMLISCACGQICLIGAKRARTNLPCAFLEPKEPELTCPVPFWSQKSLD